MLTYILRRLLISIPLLFGITLIVFLIASAMPGDAVMAMISPEMPVSDDLIKMRKGQLGLDQPLPVQYLRWLERLSQGSLGFSFQSGEPVSKVIMDRVPATLELMLLALLLAIVVGITLGVISALKQYSLFDYFSTFFGLTGISIPDFFFGMILIYFFALRLRIFPTSGMGTAGEEFSWADNLRHVALPVITLALLRMATFMRYSRASMLEVVNNDYVRTARAKGVSEWLVTMRHILRNALIPIITIIGITLPALFAGSIIVESIFQWPGIGLMFINAVTNRDSPVIMGFVLISAIIVLASNLLTDIAYSWVDPRIRYD